MAREVKEPEPGESWMLSWMARVVVFDLWYTLISPNDHRETGTRSIDVIPSTLELDPDAFARFWAERLPEHERSPRLVLDSIVEFAAGQGRALTDDERARVDLAYGAAHDEALRSPRTDVLDALAALATDGVRMGLLSNAHEREVRGWDASLLSRTFDVACFSCHIGAMKPDPEAFACVLDRLGVLASDAVFVGDGASDELAGAKAAGFARAVCMRGFLRDAGTDEDQIDAIASDADAVIDSIGELQSYLQDAQKP